jgi:lysophospholipase L1-like esterase
MRLFYFSLAPWLACMPTLALAAAPAIPPSAPPVTFRSGPTLACVGDSECVQGQVSNPPTSLYYSAGSSFQIGSNANSIIGWLGVASGGGFVIDYINQAYPGNYGGLAYIRVLTRGTGCPASTTVTVTPSTPTGSPVNTAGNLTFSTDASGNTPVAGTTIYEPNATAQGSGYIANPSFTINKTCTVPPTFGYALTGAGSYGVNGDTTPNWVQRIQSEVCKNKPDWAFNVIGTNDIVAAVLTEAQINANTLAGLQAEQACGIRTILMGIAPRTIGVGGWTQALDQERLRINAWRRNLALVTQAGNIASTSGLATVGGLIYPVIYVDVDHLWNDPSQSGATAGNPNPNNTIDGLHQSSQGAFFEALAAWNQLRTFFPQGAANTPNTQNDV